MKHLFKPFEQVSSKTMSGIWLVWVLGLLSIWISSSFSSVHLFPTPSQVGNGLIDLWNDGLVVHIFSSLILCVQSVFLSVLISFILAYSFTIPFFKPLGVFISKFRYLPLTGISFYIAIFIHGGRGIQIGILIAFMTSYLVTSLIQMIQDIPEEELDHARTLGCNRWEVLWEVVIKGRFDYVFEMVRQNLAIVWMMLVTVEGILAAAGGLGLLIQNHDRLGNSGKVVALQIIIILFGIIFDFILTKLRRLIFRYSNY